MAGQQVYRHRVAGEGIDDEHIKLLWVFLFKLQAGVAKDDVGFGLGVGQEGEVLLRNVDD